MIRATLLTLALLFSGASMAEKCDDLTKVEPNHLPEYQSYTESRDAQLDAGIPEHKFNYYCVNNVEYMISRVAVLPEYQKNQDVVLEIFEQLEHTSNLTDRILDVVPNVGVASN